MIFWKRLNAPAKLCALPDESLCREAAEGNHDAFLVLFDRYWADVFRLANSVLRNPAEAEDLVQGLFLEVHTTLLGYDEQRGSFRTLLFRYAYTRAIDHRRHLESRRYYTSVQIEEIDREMTGHGESVASGLSLEEGKRNVDWFRFWMQRYERKAPTYDPDQYVRWRELKKLQMHSFNVVRTSRFKRSPS